MNYVVSVVHVVLKELDLDLARVLLKASMSFIVRLLGILPYKLSKHEHDVALALWIFSQC